MIFKQTTANMFHIYGNINALNQNIIPPKFLKILKFFNKKYHNPNISENQCPTIFGNSWSMNFSKCYSTLDISIYCF